MKRMIVARSIPANKDKWKTIPTAPRLHVYYEGPYCCEIHEKNGSFNYTVNDEYRNVLLCPELKARTFEDAAAKILKEIEDYEANL